MPRGVAVLALLAVCTLLSFGNVHAIPFDCGCVACAQEIPTLSEWAVIVVTATLLATGVFILRRQVCQEHN